MIQCLWIDSTFENFPFIARLRLSWKFVSAEARRQTHLTKTARVWTKDKLESDHHFNGSEVKTTIDQTKNSHPRHCCLCFVGTLSHSLFLFHPISTHLKLPRTYKQVQPRTADRGYFLTELVTNVMRLMKWWPLPTSSRDLPCADQRRAAHPYEASNALSFVRVLCCLWKLTGYSNQGKPFSTRLCRERASQRYVLFSLQLETNWSSSLYSKRRTYAVSRCTYLWYPPRTPEDPSLHATSLDIRNTRRLAYVWFIHGYI